MNADADGSALLLTLKRDISAGADVSVRSELLWQLAAVLTAQQPWWLGTGSKARGSALQGALVTAQHQLLSVSGLLLSE